ncbi:hypothetical protein [Adonisia turfae]|uniref:hypothetical protein n=1 Tax=Adonisia turfae TaxID=2950184 RepID=UPI002029B356|nr:hypothetical protein [Adonisia turfae]
MQPFREKYTPETVTPLPLPLVSNPQIALALATLPFLAFLIMGRTLTYWLMQFGMASEEIFRGIQLPVLDADPHRPL